MHSHFTFFASYYEAVKDIEPLLKAEFFDVLFEYALNDKEPPTTTTPIVKALFMMAKPNIDSSKQKRENGKQGGSKPKANTKQTEANTKQTEANTKQTEANTKQSGSDKEKEKEKEKEIDKDIGVFSEIEFQKINSYRKLLKKPIKTQQAITGISNNFKECYEHGYSFEELFEIMQTKQWQTIKLEWAVKESPRDSPIESGNWERVLV